jgi:hypothetical protein
MILPLQDTLFILISVLTIVGIFLMIVAFIMFVVIISPVRPIIVVVEVVPIETDLQIIMLPRTPFNRPSKVRETHSNSSGRQEDHC